MDTSHYRRYKGYDYSRGASFLITVSTEPRREVFGHVQDGAMHLSQLGKVALESIRLIPELNEGITLYGHVVMPDHVHFRLYLAPGLADPLKALGYAVRGFKSHVAAVANSARSLIAQQDGAVAVAKPATSSHNAQQDGAVAVAKPATSSHNAQQDGAVAVAKPATSSHNAQQDGAVAHASAGETPTLPGALALPLATAPSCREMSTSRGFWQRGYHDHILTSRAFIEAVERYIAMNPLKWELQKNGPRHLRIIEPLESPRIAQGEYWRGVGNVALLNPDAPLASVRISRKCDAADINAALRRLSTALDKGYTLISGFISKGEQALRDMVLARRDARFIVALPEPMQYGYKPDSRYLRPIAEGRCLVMAHGMEGIDFGRAACLDLNDRIAAMARAGEGCAFRAPLRGAWHGRP